MRIENIYQLLSLDDKLLIENCYLLFLGRPVDALGLAYYINRLNNGYSKDSVVLQIARSKEALTQPPVNLIGWGDFVSKRSQVIARLFSGENSQKSRQLRLQERALNSISEALQLLNDSIDTQNIAASNLHNVNIKKSKLNSVELSPNAAPEKFLQRELKEHVQFIEDLGVAKPELYVVIPSYEDYKILEVCVQSILLHGAGVVDGIVISDDASKSSEHKAFLAQLEKRSLSIPLKVLYSSVNEGFSANVNRGFKAVPEGADILLLNSDTEIKKGAIESLMSVSKRSSGIVGARLLYPNGQIQHGGGFRNFNSLEWFEHLYRGRDRMFVPSLVSQNVLFCTGAALYIPQVVHSKVGLFDEGFKMGFEDVDYCIRSWEKGFPVVYCGASEIIHHESVTRGRVAGARELLSQEYFWSKYKSFFGGRCVKSKTNKVKIIFVLKDTGVGGGHRVIFNFADHLYSAGHDVEVWSLAEKPKWYDFKNPQIIFRQYDNFSLLEKNLTPLDAIKIATWWETAEYVWRASLFNGIPLWLSQDIETSYYSNRDTFNEMRAFASYRPEFTYVTNYKWIRRVFEINFCYHTNHVGLAVDDDKFFEDQSSKNRKPRSILVCARGEPIKGFAFSKEIISELLKQGYKITAYGHDESLVAGLGVSFVNKPSDDQLRKLFNTHQFFLQTSIHEGFSLPPLEAMSCGCLPIVTDAFGNRDYNNDGYNCVVIPRDLQQALEKISSINWAEHKDVYLKGMRETVEEYNWADCYQRLDKLIEEISVSPIYGKTKWD